MKKSDFLKIGQNIEKKYKAFENVLHSYLYIHGCVRYNDNTFQFCKLNLDESGKFEDIQAILEKIPYKGIGAFSLYWQDDLDSVKTFRITNGVGGGGKAHFSWSEEEYKELEKLGFQLCVK